MKRSTIALTTAAAVVVLGGAAVGGYALTTSPEPTATPAAVSTETPAPSESATPEATPSAEPVATSTPAPTYTEAESDFLYGARQVVNGYVVKTDAELLDAGYALCESLTEGADPTTISPFPELPAGAAGSYVGVAESYLC